MLLGLYIMKCLLYIYNFDSIIIYYKLLEIFLGWLSKIFTNFTNLFCFNTNSIQLRFIINYKLLYYKIITQNINKQINKFRFDKETLNTNSLR